MFDITWFYSQKQGSNQGMFSLNLNIIIYTRKGGVLGIYGKILIIVKWQNKTEDLEETESGVTPFLSYGVLIVDCIVLTVIQSIPAV